METTNWSASLEHGEYAEDRDLVVKDAIEAIAETPEGCYVNLVTPNGFGEPEAYLADVIRENYGETVTIKYIDQCGCGGHVLRVFR